MDSTHEFVKKVQDTQEKALKNQQQHGEGNSASRKPSKQHSTNK